MPRIKRPRIASPHEVRITREGETAVIEFADSTIATTHLTMGPKIHGMTNAEILTLFNEGLQATAEWRAEHPYVAIEIPPGKPQIEYSAQCHQWTPRGDVLRCVIDEGEDREPLIWIDDRELTWHEFGRMLMVHAGWGMRIKFVSDEELHVEPPTEVREPKKGER
jgi:hypothetical protein